MRRELTPELVRKTIRYEPLTGKLYWLPRPREMFVSDWAWKVFNTARTGKEALNCKTTFGYLRGTLFYHPVKAHRVAWFWVHGEWPHHIDHINGDTSDNRLDNLRNVTQRENLKNAAKSKNNASGVVGVSWHIQSRKWRAYITVDGKQISLGLFSEIEAAIAARKEAEAVYGFHPNHGREAA